MPQSREAPEDIQPSQTAVGEFSGLRNASQTGVIGRDQMTGRQPSEVVQNRSFARNCQKRSRCIGATTCEMLSIPDAIRLTHLNDALARPTRSAQDGILLVHRRRRHQARRLPHRPPGFDPAKKYPVKFLIHGGPQGAWGDDWSYRWNAELFAANGYVVVMINPRGSTGYGQAFVDGVNGDWGGKPFTDLMTGLDYAEQHYPFIDKTSRVRPRRQLRRLHGQLDPRPHQPLQVHRLPRRHVQRRIGLRHDGRRLVQHLGVQGRTRGTTTASPTARIPSANGRRRSTPKTSRRRHSSSTASSITASTSARASSSSTRCNCSASPARCSTSPTKATGC